MKPTIVSLSNGKFYFVEESMEKVLDLINDGIDFSTFIRLTHEKKDIWIMVNHIVSLSTPN